MHLSVNDMVQNHCPSVSQLQMLQSRIFFEMHKVIDSWLTVMCVYSILARFGPYSFSNISYEY